MKKLLSLLLFPLLLFSHELIDAIKEGAIDEETFWNRLEVEGTPLVEDEEITFVWRGNETTENVALLGTAWMDPKNTLLEPIAGTNIWYRTEMVEEGTRGVYFLSPNDPLENTIDKTNFDTLFKNWCSDPYNHKRYLLPSLEKVFSEFRVGNPSEEPLLVPRTVHQLISHTLENGRIVQVYLPEGYDEESSPYPLLFFFDGGAYTGLIPTPTLLDNLIAEEKIAPLVAVFVGNLDDSSRSIELPCNLEFATFLADELLPWVQTNYHVTKQAALAGSSYGGLAAAYVALTYPECFNKVLSQSGSFWWHGEWLVDAFERLRKKDLLFYLSVGKFETHQWDPQCPDMVSTNRHMRDVLKKQGYPVIYEEVPGGHDYPSWRSDLPEGLMALFGRPLESLKLE